MLKIAPIKAPLKYALPIPKKREIQAHIKFYIYDVNHIHTIQIAKSKVYFGFQKTPREKFHLFQGQTFPEKQGVFVVSIQDLIKFQ